MTVSPSIDIQADLAARFTVPCPGEWEDGEHYDCHDGQQQRTQTTNDDCKTCHGSGGRYPFRLACPECKRFPGFRDECGACSGLSYVFNPDPDVLWAAVRASGGPNLGDFWTIQVETFCWGGDSVQIHHGQGGYTEPRVERIIGHVLTTEGLRGQAALEAALHRAMEAE